MAVLTIKNNRRGNKRNLLSSSPCSFFPSAMCISRCVGIEGSRHLQDDLSDNEEEEETGMKDES